MDQKPPTNRRPQPKANVRIVILMGVSGSGKTTIGQRLAKDLNWRFYEGDNFHPKTNVDKMRRRIALTDEDRAPWLAALDHLIQDLIQETQSAVIACSALKHAYRVLLEGNRNQVVFVYLKGSYNLIRERLLARKGHFMNPDYHNDKKALPHNDTTTQRHRSCIGDPARGRLALDRVREIEPKSLHS